MSTVMRRRILSLLAILDHCGRNLDALADCLQDVGPAVLLWDGWTILARADERVFGQVLDVLAERASRSPAFVVLLRGAGPELPDVSLLD